MTTRKKMIQKRLQLVKDLEQERKSRIICYFLGDRQGYPQGLVPDLATVIASDAIRPFYDHLEGMGNQDKIDLFLYSRGGDTNIPLRLVRLIREHCKYFSVLVPFRAHSAATMICLGADEIVMGRLGEISPVDPTTANVFNPIDPLNPAGRWPISVEDLTAYFTLARETARLDTEESIQRVFRALTDKINPIALGNVHRTYKLIRILVPKLLGLHMDSSKVEQKEKIEKIAEILTVTLYTHSYPISRKEARDTIGLNVVEPNPKLETLMWSLYKQYEQDLKLLQPFDPAQILRQTGQQSATFSEETGVIESCVRTHSFMQEGEILPPPTLQQIQQILQALPPQLLAQMVPQLIQLAQSLSMNPPSVKFTSQQWR
jgi:hypothetical protein